MALGFYASAQISVTATAGTTTGTYTTLKGAFDAINTGVHQGIVKLNVTANTTETAPAVLNAVTTYTSLSIKPSVTASIVGAIPSDALVKILGSNVTIDGAVAAGGTTKNLTFNNTSNGSSVFLGSSASANPLKNVVVKNSVFLIANSNSSNIILSNGVGGNTGYFNNISIQDNTFNVGYNGVYISANATAGNGDKVVVSGNLIESSIVQNGVYIGGASGAVTVSNNTINVLTTRTTGTGINPLASFGININDGANNVSAFGNKITVKNPTSVGVTYAAGIYAAPGAANVSTKIYNNIISEVSGFYTYVSTAGISIAGETPNVSIYNNKISGGKNTNPDQNMNGISLVSTSAAANTILYNNVISDVVGTGESNTFGIVVYSGFGYKLYHNTVNLNTSNGETGTSTALLVNSYVYGSNAIDLRNNILVNNKTTGTRVAIYSGVAKAVFSNIDNNNYYSNENNALGNINNTVYNGLAGLQTGFGGNVNSLSILPVFVSTTDQHLKPDAIENKNLDNKGVSLPVVATDFDGVARVVVPDMGAYGFTSTALAVTDIHKNNLSVYPNPFRSVLNISDVKDVKTINVSDASGRIIVTPRVSQELNLSSLAKGVYFVTVSYENGSARSFKVIKE